MLRDYGARRGTEQRESARMKRKEVTEVGGGKIYVLMQTRGRKKNSVGGGRRGNPYMEGQAREASRGRVQALANGALLLAVRSLGLLPPPCKIFMVGCLVPSVAGTHSAPSGPYTQQVSATGQLHPTSPVSMVPSPGPTSANFFFSLRAPSSPPFCPGPGTTVSLWMRLGSNAGRAIIYGWLLCF